MLLMLNLFFLEQGLVYRFNGYCPHLSDLHKRIFETWKPLLTNELNIPLAQGFFVVAIDNVDDKKKICESGP